MAPKKRKAEKAAVTASPAGRATRSDRRTTRSSPNPKLVELPDTRKSPAKKKAKKADAKRKGKAKVKEEVSVSEDVKDEEAEEDEASENGQEDANKTVIVVEYCKQCSSFKKRANEVKIGLEQSGVGVIVKLNPEKPRKGCFEIRQEGEGGKIFVSLLEMKRPFKPMKDLDMEQVISDIVDGLSNANGL